jgi:membrane-associated phospholipid phosphatase
MTPAPTPPKAAQGLFLQEWAFGILLVYLALRGWVRLGPTDPATWIPATLLAIDAALIRWDFQQNSVVSGRCRLLFHAVAMNVVYWRLGQDVPRIHDAKADSWLLGTDRRWLGETPALSLAPIVHPALTEILSGCYLLFYPAMAGYQCVWLLATPALARRFFAGLYLVYAVGFVGYTLAPAKGPWIHLASSFEPLKGGPMTALTDIVVRNGCNGVDVFPSLHTAVMAYFVGFDFLNGRRRRAAAMLLPAIGLCLGTVYLRYHYAVDALAGLVLAAVALRITRSVR